MMAPGCSAAERRADVRRSARAWQVAGFLGHESRGAIEARFPDDRVRLPPGFRALAFVLAVVAVLGAFGFLLLVGDGGGERSIAGTAAVFAVLCAVGTEVQRGPLRRADAGAEQATALLVLVFTGVAVVIWAGLLNARPAIPLGALAVLSIVLVARWGSGLLGLLAALLVFAWLAQFEAGRALWVLCALVAIGPLLAGSRHPALAPSHRLACWLGAGVAVVALCLAVNLWSWDGGWVEDLRLDRSGPGPATGAALRPVLMGATVVLPLVVVVAGARRRETLLVVLGIAGLAGALVTVRHYLHVLPLAWALILAGSAMLAGALGLRRWLRAGPGGERHGWTADGLFTDENRTAAVKDVIGSVAFTPDARAGGTIDRTGEGRFGGGGATGNY